MILINISGRNAYGVIAIYEDFRSPYFLLPLAKPMDSDVCIKQYLKKKGESVIVFTFTRSSCSIILQGHDTIKKAKNSLVGIGDHLKGVWISNQPKEKVRVCLVSDGHQMAVHLKEWREDISSGPELPKSTMSTTSLL